MATFSQCLGWEMPVQRKEHLLPSFSMASLATLPCGYCTVRNPSLLSSHVRGMTCGSATTEAVFTVGTTLTLTQLRTTNNSSTSVSMSSASTMCQLRLTMCWMRRSTKSWATSLTPKALPKCSRRWPRILSWTVNLISSWLSPQSWTYNTQSKAYWRTFRTNGGLQMMFCTSWACKRLEIQSMKRRCTTFAKYLCEYAMTLLTGFPTKKYTTTRTPGNFNSWKSRARPRPNNWYIMVR